MQQNTGGCALPRNKGLAFSRGEYIFFIDADDTITPTAFEELYMLAKKFDVDVVACEKYYNVPEQFWYNAEYRKQLKPFTYRQGEFVTEPALLTDNILERIQMCHQKWFLWNLWSKLIRRDFILENELNFADSMLEDLLFTSCMLCIAEKFLIVPNVVNYYRLIEGSVSHTTDRGSDYFKKYFKALTPVFRYLDEFLSKRKISSQYPNLKYSLFVLFVDNILGYLQLVYDQIPPHDLDEILRKELASSDNIALAAFSFNMMNIKQLQLMQAQQQFNYFVTQAQEQIKNFNQFAQQAQQRIAKLEAEIQRLKS